MFYVLGLLMKGFIYIWILIIAMVPNIFMSGLTLCIAATVLTYFMRRKPSS
ncbi:MAG TPA: hypothetical protein VKB51_03555 [bacterium]|nr:hypothetical protein [bacterium]